MTVQGLVFSFKEMLMECEVIKTYARRFLDRTTVGFIDEARGNLESIKSSGPTDRPTRWSISTERPVRTNWSEGDSKPGKKSGHCIRAEFSFVWEIRPLDQKEFKKRSHFVLDGLASTIISLGDRNGSTLAEWSVDVGDQQSPGVHFHSQVKKFGAAPFPTSLDVPRLPALPMSPFLVLEFAIGELFQDGWRNHALVDSTDARRWRGIHAPRLTRFLEWQLERISSSLTGSPWIALKLAKPAPTCLMEDAQ